MSAPDRRQLFEQSRRTILDLVPALRDGATEAVHQARIATRRLREVLPLLVEHDPAAIEQSSAIAKRLGRALGKVRELDVIDETLRDFEQRLPLAAAVTATARAHLLEERRAARRRLVKAIDRTELRLLDPARVSPGRSFDLRSTRRHAWKPQLRRRLGALAGEAATA